MPLVLQTETNPGAATWAELAAGGGVNSIQKRIQLADLDPEESTQTFFFDDVVPTPSIVLGATYYLTTPPGVTELTSFDMTVGRFPGDPVGIFIAATPLIGESAGWPPLTATQTGSLFPNVVSGGPSLVEWSPYLNLEGDGNFSDLSAFDITVYLFYATLTGFTAPPT